MSIPLRPELYGLSEDEAVFFKSQIGIEGDEELKNHILAVQAEAYKANTPISLYTHILFSEPSGVSVKVLYTWKSGAALVTSLEKPSQTDFQYIKSSPPIYTQVSLRFGFMSDCTSKRARFPARFIAADMLHLTDSSQDGAYTALSEVQSLDQLRGSVSAIHAAVFFHLFDEEQQLQLGKFMARLLSSTPGSMIFDTHIGLPTKGHREEPITRARTRSMFCYSPETWRPLWNGGIFPKGAIDVEASLKEFDRPDVAGAKYCILVWCITVR
ncbi:uncharacterized protein ARMOST_11056 [Armillaria ostoyae]|uniref:Methyltransferase type 11 domain-containing protein n=1 Tax=Armillaria ostoyae TaxID=47428 RepID=A0A284RG26_ARMOS|nr:uncharacterized protein ARMOST_11056 [Armillaria ostoyae]